MLRLFGNPAIINDTNFDAAPLEKPSAPILRSTRMRSKRLRLAFMRWLCWFGILQAPIAAGLEKILQHRRVDCAILVHHEQVLQLDQCHFDISEDSRDRSGV